MPSTIPPMIAPGTLPSPPSTQTMKALPRKVALLSGEIGKMMLSSAPAAPAISAPMPKVIALMRLTSTPISAAASRSIRTATMARPILLSRRSRHSKTVSSERHGSDPVARQEHRADLKGAEGPGKIDRPVVGGERDQHRVVEDKIEPEGQRERDQHWRSDHTVDDAGMDGMAEGVQHAARDHDRGERMNPCVHIGEVGNIGAQHDERAVQNIDDVEDAPDQREADGDACVEAS